MIGKNVAVNGAYDCISQKYTADVVYAVHIVISWMVTNSTIQFLLVFACLAEDWKFLPVMLLWVLLSTSKSCSAVPSII